LNTKKGKDNVVADVLSQNPTQDKLASMFVITSELTQRVKDSWLVDHKLQKFIDRIRLTQNPHKHYTFENDLLRRKGKLVVGDNAELRQHILQHFHDSAIGGHLEGYAEGGKKVGPELSYICKKCKPLLQFPVGMLQPLSIPEKPWKSISMDFIVGLSKSCYMTVIFFVMDRLTKYAHSLSLAHPFGATKVTSLFMDNIIKLHGWPQNIISDRDSIFISNSLYYE